MASLLPIVHPLNDKIRSTSGIQECLFNNTRRSARGLDCSKCVFRRQQRWRSTHPCSSPVCNVTCRDPTMNGQRFITDTNYWCPRMVVSWRRCVLLRTTVSAHRSFEWWRIYSCLSAAVTIQTENISDKTKTVTNRLRSLNCSGVLWRRQVFVSE